MELADVLMVTILISMNPHPNALAKMTIILRINHARHVLISFKIAINVAIYPYLHQASN